jgi:hypothetical protein
MQKLMKERNVQHSEDRPQAPGRPSLLSDAPPLDAGNTRILGGLDPKAGVAPPSPAATKHSKLGWLAAAVAVLALGAGANVWLAADEDKEVVLASTAPLTGTPAPSVALTGEPGATSEPVSTAAILQDVAEPGAAPMSDAEKIGVEDELDKMLAKQAMPPPAPAKPVNKAPPKAKPPVKKVVAKAPAKPAAKDKKAVAVADKKKPAAPGKVATQDTDVALLAALVAHSKATQPKLSPTEVKLRQCNKLGSVAEAEGCRAKLCASSGGKEASCHSVPVAKASDEA